jgi:hypothetical protein
MNGSIKSEDFQVNQKKYQHNSLPSGKVSNEEGRIKKLILAVAPIRGNAINQLAQFLNKSYALNDLLKATQMAADLLAHESDSTLITLATLIEDKFEGNLGDLLNIARKL